MGGLAASGSLSQVAVEPCPQNAAPTRSVRPLSKGTAALPPNVWTAF